MSIEADEARKQRAEDRRIDREARSAEASLHDITDRQDRGAFGQTDLDETVRRFQNRIALRRAADPGRPPDPRIESDQVVFESRGITPPVRPAAGGAPLVPVEITAAVNGQAATGIAGFYSPLAPIE